MLNAFRLASGLLLLPLLLRLLSEADLGMYYVFLGLVALLPIVDSAFSFNIGRYVGYAMGGATRLQAQGMVAEAAAGEPNYRLLWQLVSATRALYRYLSLVILLLLGVAGTIIVGLRVHETARPAWTWLAWGLTVLAAAWEIYSGWWSVFLRGMNQVVASSRLSVVAYALKLALASALLLMGLGLASVPVAGLVAGFIQRSLARRQCLRLLAAVGEASAPADVRELLATIWPNSWRVGLQLLSGYLATNAYTVMCLNWFDLAVYYQYGLSIQVMSIVAGMASVWTVVKWPLVGQYRARQDHAALRQMLWARTWLQALTFLALAAAAVALGPWLLHWLGTTKQLLPGLWLVLIGANVFLEMWASFWTVLIATENRVPSLWPTVITNLGSLTLALVLLAQTSLGLGAIVVAPLICGCGFGYWYWPLAGARSLKISWFEFTFRKPD